MDSDSGRTTTSSELSPQQQLIDQPEQASPPLSQARSTPHFIVVLKDNAFRRGWCSKYSTAEKLQRKVEGLVAFKEDSPELKQYACFPMLRGEFQIKTVYRRHPKHPRKYVPLSKYEEHLLITKKNEFIKLMHELGAKKIRLINKDANREEASGNAGIAGGHADISAQGTHSESRTREWDCSCEFATPFCKGPVVDKEEKYLFYKEWSEIVKERISVSPTLFRYAAFTFSYDSAHLAELNATFQSFGLSIGGNVQATHYVSDRYEVTFYGREDYNEYNRTAITRWDTETVKSFFVFVELEAIIPLASQASICGIDLLSDHLFTDLLNSHVSVVHVKRLKKLVQLQINGETKFPYD